MTGHQDERSVTLKRTFDAPIELVYQAWTEAQHVVRWMKCDAAATLEVENWVPEVGAEFRTHMFQPGVFEAWGKGRFTAVEPPHLLAYTMDADPVLGTPAMSVRVALVPVDGGTELTLTHSGIPTDELGGIVTQGWTHSLGTLETVVAALQSAPSQPPPRNHP